MYVLSNEQMQRVDKETIDRICPGIELMERAGRGCAEVILHHYGDAGRAVIFAGSGNNGGDGLVIARYLSDADWHCSVHLLKEPEELTPDAGKNYQRLRELAEGGDRVVIHDATRPDWIELAEADLRDADLVIDAIFGTGVSGAPRGMALDMIQLINDYDAPVIAIDVPSGVNGSTGETPGEAVVATETLTIGTPKIGTLFHPGKHHCAEVSVIDIGFPEDIVEKHADPVYLLDTAEAAASLPYRAPALHKFEAGVVLVLAGSVQYRGAALLCAEAALRSGAGMVYLGVPEDICGEIDVALREVITVGLPQTGVGTLSPRSLDALVPYIDRADALAVGPGLGRQDETDAFVAALLESVVLPVVVDADAINALAGSSVRLASLEAPAILTPHSGELSRLVGRDVPSAPPERIAVTNEIAEELGAVLVHKGAPTLIAAPREGLWINTTGSSALATGGTGDVLTGLIAGFLAQGAEPIDAACTATYLHGRAGDLAAEQMGKRGTIAGDLLWAIGGAIGELETMVGD